MKPCFGYIRVSTVRQGDGASLEAQRDAITGFASQNGLTIIKWFEEQETASKTGRPVLDKMLGELRRGAADGLVIHKTDRFSRNYTDWARIDDIAKLGVKIYVAAESLDFDSVSGRFVADINMALAAHYSRNLSAEVKKGIYGRINQGICPFRAPIGYLDNGGGALKTLDPIKAPLVRQAFDLYCTGEYSITSLSEEMARHGLTGLAGRPVVRRNIETMLRNPFYIGKMLVCGRLYDGAHEPLISAAQFQRVKQIKAQRAQKKTTKHQRTYRGLLTCADCGKTLTGEVQKSHIYYRCHTKNCPSGSIREDRLEAQLVSRLARLQLSSEDQAELRDRLLAWLHASTSDDLARSIRLRIADAKSRQERLTDLLVDGAITQADFQLRKQNTEFELHCLEDELRQIEARQKSEADLDDLLELATNLHASFVCGTPCDRRLHLKSCLTELRVRQGKLRLLPKPWLKELRRLSKDPSSAPSAELLAELCAPRADPPVPVS